MKMAYQYFPVLYYSTFKQPYMCTVPMLSTYQYFLVCSNVQIVKKIHFTM